MYQGRFAHETTVVQQGAAPVGVGMVQAAAVVGKLQGDGLRPIAEDGAQVGQGAAHLGKASVAGGLPDGGAGGRVARLHGLVVQPAVGLHDDPAAGDRVPGAQGGGNQQAARQAGGAQRPQLVGLAIGADADARVAAVGQLQVVAEHQGAQVPRVARLQVSGDSGVLDVADARERGAGQAVDGAQPQVASVEADFAHLQAAFAQLEGVGGDGAAAQKAQGAGSVFDGGGLGAQFAAQGGGALLNPQSGGLAAGRQAAQAPVAWQQRGHGGDGLHVDALGDVDAVYEFQARAFRHVQEVAGQPQGLAGLYGQAALHEQGVATVVVGPGKRQVALAQFDEVVGDAGVVAARGVAAGGCIAADGAGDTEGLPLMYVVPAGGAQQLFTGDGLAA